MRRYPQVTRVEATRRSRVAREARGRSTERSLDSNVVLVGSVDGLLFDQDRFAVTSGRMADPARADEVMVTQRLLRRRWACTSVRSPRVARPRTRGSSGPVRRIGLKIVGIGLLNREVVQDQIAKFPTYIVATPALTRSVGADSKTPVYLGVQLRGGAADVAAVERRWNSTERYFTDFQVASQLEAEAQQSIRPEALALGVFGGIAALAALFLGIQIIARQLSARVSRIWWSCGRSGPTR